MARMELDDLEYNASSDPAWGSDRKEGRAEMMRIISTLIQFGYAGLDREEQKMLLWAAGGHRDWRTIEAHFQGGKP